VYTDIKLVYADIKLVYIDIKTLSKGMSYRLKCKICSDGQYSFVLMVRKTEFSPEIIFVMCSFFFLFQFKKVSHMATFNIQVPRATGTVLPVVELRQ